MIVYVVRDSYDIVVVGGGPSGSTCARLCAEEGLSTCLIEEHAAAGYPVQCAGLLSTAAFQECEVSRKPVLHEISGARIVTGLGSELSFDAGKTRAMVVDRAALEQEMLASAAKAGAEIRLKTAFSGISGSGIRTRGRFGKEDIRCSVLVAADGPRSSIARALVQSSPGRFALGLMLVSWVGLALAQWRARPTRRILEDALQAGLGRDYQEHIPPARRAILRSAVSLRELATPFALRGPGVEWISNLPYADGHERHLLDVYRPAGGCTNAPVLLQIHGGGWMVGNKHEQALPLIYHLAQRGWVVVTPNYRLSPSARFPDHLIDCKRALAWARRNITAYGGDPRFVAVTFYRLLRFLSVESVVSGFKLFCFQWKGGGYEDKSNVGT